MVTNISEDCLIFYGISPDNTKLRQINNALTDFINAKKKIDPSGRFNLILFMKNVPNYLDNFTFDTSLILDMFKSSIKNIVKANIAVGMMISIHLLTQNFKSVSEKLLRSLILIDSGSIKISSEHVNILTSLINKVKNLPFYLDIIGINIDNEQEVSLLKKLANLGNGEFFVIENIKDLQPLLVNLSKKKLSAEYLFSRYKLKMVQKENQPFYADLADEPIVIGDSSTCSICFQKDSEGIVMCPSCKAVAHRICWALWAKDSNPQIPHVFRCHNCFRLLKLDEKFVFEVHIGKITPIIEFVQLEKKDTLDYLQELELKNQPKLVQAEDPKVTDIRKLIESKKTNAYKKEDEKLISFDICPICNNIITEERKDCPICGFRF
ncbi:MAG: hypothetical protein ACFE8N_02825 [Promethearchaeota archaeon]